MVLMWPRIAAGILLLWLAACSREQQQPRLIGFENDYLQALFQFYPPVAARAGLEQFEGRLGDFSELSVGRRRSELARMLVRVLALQAEPLSWPEQAESRVLEYAIRNELADWSILQTWRHNPAMYVDVSIRAIHRAVYFPGETPSRRLEGVLISLTELDSMMAAMRANVTEPSPEAIREGIDRCRRLGRLLAEDLSRWAPQAAGVDLELARSFSGALPIAVRAVREGLGWLQVQAARPLDHEESLGPERFIMKVLFGSMAEIRLSDLERMASELVDRDRAALAAAAGKIAPGVPLERALRIALGEPVPASERVSAARRAVEEARQFVMRHGLVPLPGEIAGQPAYLLQPMPAYLRSPIDTGWFEPPPMQETRVRNGVWMLGGIESSWPPAERAAAEARFTEADLRWDAVYYLVPGLYLHSLHAANYRSGVGRLIPERILVNRVTQRGWAAYAEEMMWEAGFGRDDPRMEVALRRRALLRDCRFLASVDLHTRGMTLAEAERLFREKALLSPTAAAMEARAVMLDPLRLADALGKALILDLRQEFYRLRGGESLPAFHEAFLRYAPLPVPLMREALLEYEQRRAGS